MAAGADTPVVELLAGKPSPIFWEGVLALQSEVGLKRLSTAYNVTICLLQKRPTRVTRDLKRPTTY